MAAMMRAVIFESAGRVALKTVPCPDPPPDGVLIRVKACGLCGTDVHLYRGEFPAQYPLIPGHEFAGVIAEVGSQVKGWRVGERVIADPNIACGECYFCRIGQPNHCLQHAAVGVTQDGAFAEFVAVPARNVYRIGENLSFEEAAMVEPLSCVVYGLHRLDLQSGDQVLIMGAGPIGLLLLQGCRYGGAASVTIVDIDPARLQLAQSLGATQTALPAEVERLHEEAPYGYDAVVDATGVPSVVESCLRYVKSGGKLLLFGVCPEGSKISISPFEIYRRDIQIIGTFALRHSFDPALALIQNGVVRVKPLLRPMLALDEIPSVFQARARAADTLKIMFTEVVRV